MNALKIARINSNFLSLATNAMVGDANSEWAAKA